MGNRYCPRFRAILLLALITRQNASSKVQQVHIAQGRTSTSMTVSWLTTSPAESVVYYGTNQQLEGLVRGYATRYNSSSNGPLYESGFIHHVFLDNLSPATTYFYVCSTPPSLNTASVLSFTTLGGTGSPDPFTFAVVSDLGQSIDSLYTMNHIMSNSEVSLVLDAGDLSYADCSPQLWDSYGTYLEVLASRLPWMVAAGDHDIELSPNHEDGTLLTYVAFEKRFRMPSARPPEYGPVTYPRGGIAAVVDANVNQSSMEEGCMNAPSEFQRGYDYGNSFYSFDAAMVHVVVLNPYTSSNASSAQYRWLEADLLSIDRELTPWVVVMMHTPWYSSNKRHHNEWQTVAMREAMEDLLYKYDVNLVLSGHVHAYERTYPVYRAVVRHDGIVYLTVGTGGNTGEHHSEFFDQPKWSAARDGTHFGYGQLNFLTRDQLLWTWHRSEDETNTAADEVIICNKYFTGSADCYYSIWRLPMYIADIPLLVGMLTVVVLVILIIIFKCNGMDLFPPPSGTQPRDSHATDRYSKYYSSVHAASVCAEESKPLLRGP